MAGTLGLKKSGAAEPAPTAPGSVATPAEPYAGINSEANPFAGLGHVKESENAAEDADADEEIALDTGVTSSANEPPAVIRRHESIIAALEAAARQHGDVGTQTLVYQVAVAAGTLKQATGAALGKVKGEVGGVIEMLHRLL